MSPSDDSSSVDADEYVYRRFPQIYYKGSLPVPVQTEAFRPTDQDEDGISVVRARFATPQQALLPVAPAKRTSYYVVRLAVQDLLQLGLTVDPAPDASVPGHAIIPELSKPAYDADKPKCKQIQGSLAKLACQGIVLAPGHQS